ncbi:MAG TPA: AAA family ATPase [Bacteroidales bacterium]|nr:AAA family ATPase [Bacteroidales bacterium]HPS17265.1 AAA family ATPase [Bacteroidales bacterium]
MIIQRYIKHEFLKKIKSGKVLVLLGARRTGKTFFIKQILKEIKTPYLLLNGDDYTTSSLLEKRSIANYRNIIGKNKLLIIDEAQKINSIGNILKLMIDEIPGLTIIATGSSVFDIS